MSYGDTNVMWTLADARKRLLGKSGRIPERKDFSTYDGVDEEGNAVTKRRFTPNGDFARKVGCNSYLRETPEGHITLTLHSTIIATWTKWWCEVTCEDWPTHITKDNINEYTPANVSSWGRIWKHADGPLKPDVPDMRFGLQRETSEWIPEGEEPKGEYVGDDYRHHTSHHEGKAGRWYYPKAIPVEGVRAIFQPGRYVRVKYEPKMEFGIDAITLYVNKRYKPRDHILFRNGMRFNEEGYCMNPPMMHEQRLAEALTHRAGPFIRSWARKLVKANRLGELDHCEQCQDIYLSYDKGPSPHAPRTMMVEHSLEHACKGELVLTPHFMDYLRKCRVGGEPVHCIPYAADFWDEAEHHISKFTPECVLHRSRSNDY